MQNKKSKKLISILLVFMTLLSLFSITTTVQAETDDYIVRYTGSTESWGYRPNCTFTVNKIIGNKFRGNFSATNLGSYSFNENIEGNIYSGNKMLTCTFTVRFYNGAYYSNMNITVHPYDGYCECFCSGSWHMADFIMTGTRINLPDFVIPNTSSTYDEEDMKLCMALSNAAYDDKFTDNNTPKKIIKIAKENNFYTENELVKSNLHKGRNERDNISYTLIPKPSNQEGRIDLYVILRGTTEDEWKGNMEIAGTSYNDSIEQHYSFRSGTDFLTSEVEKYLFNKSTFYKNKTIDFHITGHSRGAAVANLYAKHLTNNRMISYTNGNNEISYFDVGKVTAYTFATPNVEKYNHAMLTNYTNIHNFCFYEDFVPTIPLTVPDDGWNYWKYGITYWVSISDLMSNRYISNLSANAIVNKDNVKDMVSNLTKWDSVEKYYNRYSYNFEENTPITAYDFFHEGLAVLMMRGIINKGIGGLTLYSIYKQYPDFVPLILTTLLNFQTIKEAHSFDTYNSIISMYGSQFFTMYTYEMYKEIYEGLYNNADRNSSHFSFSDLTPKNEQEIFQLIAFYEQGDNANKLGWDLDDPDSWNGITWSVTGRVQAIDLSNLDLEGTLNLSAFTALEVVNISQNQITGIDLSDCADIEKLNVSINNLTNIDVSDCSSLTEYDCSVNDLSGMTSNIITSTNSDLVELNCNYCGLSTLSLSAFSNLEKISCAFNNLTTLDLTFNTLLKSVICSYNYLDVQESTSLGRTITDLQFDNDCYTNYYPQRVPENAVYNSNELNALRSFAQINSNNEILEWINGNTIDTNSLQKNVIFSRIGTEYRIAAIDISGLAVTGTLNLSNFTYLNELYCENTNITSLNTNGCSALETLLCCDCELTTLTLPSNVTNRATNLYTLSCENNHLDINMFTDNIVNNISLKSGYTLDYRHQIINAPVQSFNELDYNTLRNFAEENSSVLDWDLENPGEWEQVNWIYDTTEQKYRLLDCYFDCLNVTGNLDLSGSTRLENFTASGSDLVTVSLPDMNVNDYAFYDCKKLEAIILTGGTTIGEGAFEFCPALQAVYIPDTVNEISEDAFSNSPNVTIAGDTDSSADDFCSDNDITFKGGYFLCGNIVTKENMDNTYQYYYPVENVNVISGGISVATTDKYGYYVVFELEEGEYLHQFSYPYSATLSYTANITDSPVIVTTPVGMVSFDWNQDCYINAKDYSRLIRHINGFDAVDDIYLDINKDGIVDRSDWSIAESFFVTGTSNGTYNYNQQNDYDCMPACTFATYNLSHVTGIEEIHGDDD